jgi:type I restriction enzyme S subunit
MSAVLLEDSSDTVFSGFLLRARPRNQILDLEFCKYCFSHKQIRRQILQKASFTTRALTNGKLLSRVILLIPPTKTEQQSIATALSDVDNLITSLEQLIEKKKAIKQGTMQELLTGKRRLKGFGEGKGYKQTELGLIPEDWEVKRLHELGKFQSGIGFPLHLQGKHQEVIPFYKVSDMNNNGNEVFMLNSNNYISQKVLIELGATLIPRSSIVFAKIGAALFLERKRLLLVDSLIDNNMMAIIADIDTIDTKYLYYLLINIKLSKYANTTALPSINRNDIGEINLKIPTLYEQQAITEVLTNMDSEIENLETKVNKYKQIKQGMMQNLLIGRIRLA